MTEWGPWIEHDGKGCPCKGAMVMVARYEMGDEIVIAGAECTRNGGDINGPFSAWAWRIHHKKAIFGSVIRYRIRKPKGLTILEGILENLPQEEHAQ